MAQMLLLPLWVLKLVVGNCRSFAEAHAPPSNKLHLGSLCSGCDFIYIVAVTFWKVMTPFLKWPILVVQTFANEIKPRKRDWLRDVGFSRIIYEDITKLSKGMALNTLPGNMTLVRSAHWIYLGFECDDASFQSIHRASRTQCIATGEGQTGATFGGACAYLDNEEKSGVDLEVLWCENVTGLGSESQPKKRARRATANFDDEEDVRTNTMLALDMLRQRGHRAHVARVRSTNCGSSTTRSF